MPAPDLPTALRLRALALHTMRRFFRERGFVEVDAPLLLPGAPVESFVEVFSVTLRRVGGTEPRYLPPSPEAALKRALAVLQADCFECGHAFRDGEEEGSQHRAHFRMLEWYRVNAGYEAIMDDTVALFRALAVAFAGQTIAALEPPPVDFAAPWERLTVPEALARYAGVILRGPQDLHLLLEAVRDRHLGEVQSWQDAFCVLLSMEVEPHLGRGRPTLLCDYPTGLAMQARPKDAEPWLAEQFEVWVEGVELGNSYSEVTDAQLQRRRFTEEAARLRALGRTPPTPDPAYLDALARLPERCAGGSVGVDRTLMMFLHAGDIGQVRL
ncbi:MAG: amino acid--tRNA ligase-related protein [Pseudomonadota bacterium]